MKGIRFELLSGRVIEVTHHAGCIQPAEAWVKAHREAHAETLRVNPNAATIERIVEFESPRPIDRSFNMFGELERDDSTKRQTSDRR